MNNELVPIMIRLDELIFNQRLVLSALRNVLAQNNHNNVNDYLINQIERRL